VKRTINFDIVKLLVEAGADVNIRSIHGVPLCFTRDESIARYLIENGADLNYWHDNGGSPLFFSVWQSDPTRLRMLLDLGADPHRTNPLTGESALHTAVLSAGNSRPGSITDDLDVLRCLLAAGVDPNQKTKVGVRSSNRHTPHLDGDTPLHLAAAYVDANLLEPILDALVTGGADKSVANGAGKTPFELAIDRGRPQEVLDLLKMGNDQKKASLSPRT
jgi:ankyrin repeat protein